MHICAITRCVLFQVHISTRHIRNADHRRGNKISMTSAYVEDQNDGKWRVTLKQIKGSFREGAISRPSGWYDVTEYDPILPGSQHSNQQQPLTATDEPLGPPREFEIDKIKDGEIYLRWRGPSPRRKNEIVERYDLTISNYISFYDPQNEHHRYDSSQRTTVIPIRNNTSYEFRLAACLAGSVSEPRKITLVLRKHEVLKKSTRKDATCEEKPQYFVPLFDATAVGQSVIRMDECDALLNISNNSKQVGTGIGTFEKLSSKQHFPDYNTDGVMLLLGNNCEKLAFIGSLLNFCLGVQYEDQFRFTPQQYSFHTENVQSHTMVYPLRYQEGLEMRRITICDLQDHTANMVWWKRNNILKTCTLKTLLKTTCDPARGGVDHVNAIALVLRSDGPPPEAYVLNSLRAMFGRDVVKHVFLIFTDNDTDKARLLSDRRWGSLCSDIKNVEHRYSLNTKLILATQEPGEQIWYPLMEKCRSLLTKVSSMEPMVVTRK